MIGICTDSSSQLPPSLAQRYGVEVVPITVTVGEHDYLEGIDFTVDDYDAMCSGGNAAVLTLGEPSPGQFALAYEALIDRGCTQILSIHSSSALSGTLNAARLAAHNASVPVRLVESGTDGFGVSCCVWAAAEAIANGASFDETLAVADSLAPGIGRVFLVTVEESDRIVVVSARDTEEAIIENVPSIVEAVNAMARFVLGWGPRLYVGVGTASVDAAPISAALAQAVGESANVLEVVEFRVGPSAGLSAGHESSPAAVSCFGFRASTPTS